MSQATNVRVAPRQVGIYLAQTILVFAAFFIAGKLGQATHNIRSSSVGPVWPAYGIALAAILLCGYRVWIGVLLAAFLVAFSNPVPLVTSIGQVAGTTLAAVIGAFLLLRIAKFLPSLSRLRDALALIVLGGLGSAAVSATIGVSVLYATHVQAYSGLGSAWLIYWLGDSTGVLLVTPLVLTFPDLLRIRSQVRIAEFAALLLLLAMTCFMIFGDLSLVPVKLHVLAFAVLPFAMWAAIRFGVSGAALSILIVATISTIETALGSGPFAQNSPFTNAVLLDVFFAVLSVSGITLAAVIAEREHAERERVQLVRKQAAIDARLRLATIVESSDAAIISKNLDGVIKSCNAAAESIFGYTEAEMVGQPITILVPPELWDEENEILQTLKGGGRIEQLETVRVTKTGNRINVSLSISPIRDPSGRTVGISDIARDITERKQAEEALRASEGRRRLAQEVAGIATFERDIRTGRITWAEGLDPLYGLSPGSLDGKPLAFFKDLVHPADWERSADLIQQAIKTGQPTEGEWRAVWPDGSFHWIVSRWQVFMDASGEPLRVVGVNLDITRRKQMEEELSGMSLKLIAAQEQERARIARELHDDINQRIAMLSVELEQLQQSPTEIQYRVQEIRKELRQISDDVQSISHDLHSSKLEYLGAIAGMKSWCQEVAARHKSELVFRSEFTANLPLDLGLPLFRVLQESVNNSIKHSGEKRVEVQLWEHSSEIHLIVRDSGKGFDVETAMRGKGLGLTSMRERVRLVNGTIAIESRPMEGTNIHVRIPFEQQSKAEPLSA